MHSDHRCFFALTFSADAKSRLGKARDALKMHAAKGVFTHTDNFHMTLEFIGAVPSEQLSTLKGVLHALDCVPLTLNVTHFGHFHLKGRQLIWLGTDEHPALMNLQSELRMKLADTPFSPENRPYIPHITLGRNVILATQLKALHLEPFLLSVHSIALMESQRVNDRLLYQVLDEVLLPE